MRKTILGWRRLQPQVAPAKHSRGSEQPRGLEVHLFALRETETSSNGRKMTLYLGTQNLGSANKTVRLPRSVCVSVLQHRGHGQVPDAAPWIGRVGPGTLWPNEQQGKEKGGKKQGSHPSLTAPFQNVCLLMIAILVVLICKDDTGKDLRFMDVSQWILFLWHLITLSNE